MTHPSCCVVRPDDGSALPGSSPKPTIDVIIVNFRSEVLIRACVGSLYRYPPETCAVRRIFIVDNSSDMSDAALGAEVEILRPGRNLGFGAACNLAAQHSTADLLLFLNPDAEVLDGTLDEALAALGETVAPEKPDVGSLQGTVGIVGVQLVDACGRVQRTCSRFPRPVTLLGQVLGLHLLVPGRFGPFMSDWDHSETRSVDQVMGAVMLTRRSTFLDLGGFDPRFFLYYEDMDLCLRVKAGGQEVLYAAGAQARHIGQGSSRTAVALRLHQFLRSRVLFARKHFGVIPAAALAIASATVEPVLRLAQATARRESPGPVLLGFLGFWRDLPTLFWSRNGTS